MKVTLLGTGTPGKDPNRFQSSALVEVGSNLLLFDTGRGAVHQMYQAGVDVGRVSPVFITHHHVDHINDLYDVIFSTAGQGREGTLPIYGPAGTQQIVDALLNGVYARDNRFRIEEEKKIRGFQFLSAKPRVVIENVSDGRVEPSVDGAICVPVAIESELEELDKESRELFQEEYGIEQSSRSTVISSIYRRGGLISFLTAGDPEVRAWTVPAGTLAVEAAGAIHSDIEL